jgi:hypothetical protein
MEQLMPALHRPNQPWVEDPTAEGGDEYRIFLADSKLKRPSASSSGLTRNGTGAKGRTN